MPVTDLSVSLRSISSQKSASFERREAPRYAVEGMRGEIVFMNEKTPFQLKDISLSGCGLTTLKGFRAGALATIELRISHEGNFFQLYGRTEWARGNDQLGVRFLHPSNETRIALRDLLAYVIDQQHAALVPEEGCEDEPPVENPCDCPSAPEQPQAAAVVKPKLLSDKLTPPFIRWIHEGACRASSVKEGEWKIQLMFIDSSKLVQAWVIDISYRGCIVQALQEFADECDSRVQMALHINEHRFILYGEPHAICDEDPSILGIKFVDVNPRRREFLDQLIRELRARA